MTAPLLSLFLRIRITMYYDDHNPLTFMRNTREHKDGTTEGRPALQSSRKWRKRGPRRGLSDCSRPESDKAHGSAGKGALRRGL